MNGLGRSCEAFGYHLTYWRLERCLTQAELGKLAGINATQISAFEKYRRLPSYQNLYRLAKALHVTPNDLMGIGIP